MTSESSFRVEVVLYTIGGSQVGRGVLWRWLATVVGELSNERLHALLEAFNLLETII